MLKPRNVGPRKAQKAQKKAPSRKARGGTQPAKASRFSGQSFGGGLVCGAVAVLALIYAPALWSGTATSESSAAVAKRPALTYEFMSRLPIDEVVTDVTPFEPAPEANDEPATSPAEPLPVADIGAPDAVAAAKPAPAADTVAERSAAVANVAANGNDEASTREPLAATESAASTYLLQAASFRNRDDANAMRATLLLEGMRATVNEAPHAEGAWYRVVVGPFASQGDLERTLTQLRIRDIPAVRVPPSG